MDNISYIGSLFKMFFALAVVLSLMVGTVYLLKNILGRAKPGGDAGDLIKVLAIKSLGPRSSIMVIETLGKVTVIGLTGGQMQPLATVDDPEALAKIPENRTPLTVNSPGFPIEDLLAKARKALKRK